MPIADCKGVPEDGRIAIYANVVVSQWIYYLALKKLADVGKPMRVSLLVNSINYSKNAFNPNTFNRYEEGTIKLAIWRLGKDRYLINKIKRKHNFVLLEITDFGRQVVKLAEEMKKEV
jgi:hypothetical protein